MSEELTQSHKEKLMSDLKMVIADAEELLKLTAGNVGDKAAEMRMRMQSRMEQAKSDLVDLQDMAVVRVRDAGRAADAYVQDNPWRAVGIAAGVGLVVGMLIIRR
ncbi:MAG: DUF883 domain-containing protein [Ramlibacter sp.]|nr:DUF883 domain-containing protein [Ramlibacter sp.]